MRPRTQGLVHKERLALGVQARDGGGGREEVSVLERVLAGRTIAESYRDYYLLLFESGSHSADSAAEELTVQFWRLSSMSSILFLSWEVRSSW